MNEWINEELLSAYLDGEVTAEEQAQIEKLLALHPEARQLLDELRALSGSLQSLPPARLETDLGERVIRSAQRRILTGEEPLAAPQHSSNSFWTTIRRRVTGRALFWPAVAAALALWIVLTDVGRWGEHGANWPIARAPVESKRAEPAKADSADQRPGVPDATVGSVQPAAPTLADASLPPADAAGMKLDHRFPMRTGPATRESDRKPAGDRSSAVRPATVAEASKGASGEAVGLGEPMTAAAPPPVATEMPASADENRQRLVPSSPHGGSLRNGTIGATDSAATAERIEPDRLARRKTATSDQIGFGNAELASKKEQQNSIHSSADRTIEKSSLAAASRPMQKQSGGEESGILVVHVDLAPEAARDDLFGQLLAQNSILWEPDPTSLDGAGSIFSRDLRTDSSSGNQPATGFDSQRRGSASSEKHDRSDLIAQSDKLPRGPVDNLAAGAQSFEGGMAGAAPFATRERLHEESAGLPHRAHDTPDSPAGTSRGSPADTPPMGQISAKPSSDSGRAAPYALQSARAAGDGSSGANNPLQPGTPTRASARSESVESESARFNSPATPLQRPDTNRSRLDISGPISAPPEIELIYVEATRQQIRNLIDDLTKSKHSVVSVAVEPTSGGQGFSGSMAGETTAASSGMPTDAGGRGSIAHAADELDEKVRSGSAPIGPSAANAGAMAGSVDAVAQSAPNASTDFSVSKIWAKAAELPQSGVANIGAQLGRAHRVARFDFPFAESIVPGKGAATGQGQADTELSSAGVQRKTNDVPNDTMAPPPNATGRSPVGQAQVSRSGSAEPPAAADGLLAEQATDPNRAREAEADQSASPEHRSVRALAAESSSQAEPAVSRQRVLFVVRTVPGAQAESRRQQLEADGNRSSATPQPPLTNPSGHDGRPTFDTPRH